MDRETVERVARTAHIRLTEEEIDPESDKRGINPIEVADVLRDDEPRMEIDADVLLRDMDTYERYVRGPRLS